MNELILKPSKLKWLGVLAGSSAFVIIGFVLLNSTDNQIMGLITILFFGLGVVVSLVQFLPNSAYLKLAPVGFETKSLFRTNFVKWSYVTEFIINSQNQVGYDFTLEGKTYYEQKYPKLAGLIPVAKNMAGTEGALADTYGLPPEKLRDLMNEWRNKNLLNSDSVNQV